MASNTNPPDVADLSSPSAPGLSKTSAPGAFAFSLLLESQHILVVISAMSIIWLGAHGSLRRPPSAAPAKLKNGEKRRKEEKFAESLDASDAIRFPIMLAAVLVGLYYLIQWLEDPAIINKILRGYMGILSITGLGELTRDALDILASLIFPAVWVDGKGQVCHIDRDRRCQYVINRETGEEIVIKGRESPLPGRLANLAPSDRSRRRLWNLRHLLKEEWTVLFLIRGVVSETFNLHASDFLGFAFAGAAALAYHWTGWDALSNLLSIAMCYVSFMVISPTSFSIGTLVLASLFVYDIVMVFYTPYMITVAKNIDAPIKLVFTGSNGVSMLGLGDIVVPGMLIALALRFDLFQYYQQQARLEPVQLTTEITSLSAPGVTNTTTTITTHHRRVKAPYVDTRGQWGNRFWTTPLGRLLPVPEASDTIVATAFPKPYFYASLAGYAVGMLVTLIVMLVYRHGQPALLYLVPGVTGSLWLTGLWRGELKDMWGYIENGSLDTEDVVVEVDGEGKVFQQRVDVESKEDKKENGEGKAETETPAKNEGGEQKRIDKEASQPSSAFLFAFSVSMPCPPGPEE